MRQLERKEKFGQEATYVRVAYPLCANADFACHCKFRLLPLKKEGQMLLK
jgi:hypothetical protein